MTRSRRDVGRAAGVGLLMLAATPLAAQPNDQAAVAAGVTELHAAIIAADQARLSAITAENLTYGHSAGRLENKAQFIDQLVSKRSVYRSINTTQQDIVVTGDVATVRQTLAVETVANGQVVPSKLGVLLVWHRQANGWRLLARQSVALPA